MRLSNHNRAAVESMHWIEGRWHLDGKGIHAGVGIECRFPDGTWVRGRIESADAGRKLFFHFDYHGCELQVRVDPEGYDELPIRWPEEGRPRR